MPIYEYECTQCGHHLEALQKVSEDPITVCPKCNGHVQRLVSATSFQLKGTGWYATDFRNKGKSPEKKPATDSDSKKDNSSKTGDSSQKSQSTDTAA